MRQCAVIYVLNCLLLLTTEWTSFVAAFSRLSEQQRITAIQGEDVVLPCDIDYPDNTPVPYIVQWRRNNVKIPIYILYEGYQPHHGEGYHGRISIADQASLNITSVKQSDQGLYECKIVYLNRETPKNGTLMYLEVLAPPHFVVKPPDTIYTTIGETLEIQCSAAGTPNPIIEWFKDRIKLYSGNGLQLSSKKLKINTIKQSDVADYMCKARNKEGEATAYTKVIIAGGAVITIPPQNITLQEGNKAEFLCESKALPSNLTHHWYLNDMPITDLPWLSQRISILDDGTLIIDRTLADDSGKFTCEVTNGIGQHQTSSAYLDVQYPARVTYNPSLQYLPLGLPGVLRCFFESNPPVLYVKWTKDNRNIQPESALGIEMLKNNGSLYFENIKEVHQGRYTCTPYNIHGTSGVSNIMEVLVKAPPVYVVKPEIKYMRQVNSDIDISCRGSGTPNPKIYWRKAGGREMPRGRWYVKNGVLSLKGLKKEDHGYYECVLMNEIATLVTSTLIVVKGTTPHSPTNVSVNTSTHAATLTWLPGFNGGFKQTYNIWYKLADDGDNTWKKMKVPQQSTIFTIHNLLKNVQYDFKVQSRNSLGPGSSSRIVRASTKYSIIPTDYSGAYPSHYDPGVPIPARPTKVRAKASGVNQVALSWFYGTNQSVPISHFTIEHALKESGPWKQIEGIISPPITKLTFSDVEGGKKHYYRIFAHYKSLKSKPSDFAEILVPLAPAVDRQKAITAGIVGGLLFFVVAIILAICAVKICNKRKRRKAEKAYMMVTCPVPVGVNGNHLPSPVPLKKRKKVQEEGFVIDLEKTQKAEYQV